MKKAIRTIIIIVVVIALVGGGYYGYTNYYLPQKNALNISTLQVVKLSTGSVAQTISATGTVRTAQTAQLTWQASGTVGKIDVKVGDQVKAGQVLASLDPGSLPNNILTAQQSLVTDQQALTNLTSSQTTLAQAQQAIITDQTAVTNAQNARNLLNTARGTPGQIAAAQATYLQSKERADKLQQTYDSTPGDPTTDSVKALALTNLVNANNNLAIALQQMQWIQGKPDAADIAAADNTLALAKAKLADDQNNLNQLHNGANPADVAAAKAQIAADQATIQLQYVTAPFDGTITVVSNMVGDSVSNNSAAFRLDNLTAYYVDLQINETDIAKIQTGQPVTFTFDAIPNKTYNGTVTSVGQIGTPSSSTVTFTVTAKFTDANASVRAGMTASANVIVASLNNVLVVPSRALRTINNRQVVYVLSSTPISAFGGNGTTSSQGTRTPGSGQNGTGGTGNSGNGQGTGSTGNNSNGQGTAGTGGFTGANGAGGTRTFNGGAFAGGFNSTAFSPILTSSGESLYPVLVEVGVAGDTYTQVISNRLQLGDLIVVNLPTNTSTLTTNRAGGFGGAFGGGGGIRVAGGFGRGG